MKVECPKCSFTGNIKDELIPEAGKNVVCPKCKTKFLVKKGLPKEHDDNIKTVTSTVEQKTKRTFVSPKKSIAFKKLEDKRKAKRIILVGLFFLLGVPFLFNFYFSLKVFCWEYKLAAIDGGKYDYDTKIEYSTDPELRHLQIMILRTAMKYTIHEKELEFVKKYGGIWDILKKLSIISVIIGVIIIILGWGLIRAVDGKT